MRTLVKNATRAVGLARACEASLVGAAAAGVTLAAAVASGGDLLTPGPIGAGLLCALCAAATWALEQRPRAARIARVLDRGLHLDGGLLTAFEAEERTPDAPLTRLLTRRVLARVDRRSAAACSLPNSLPFLALPFLAAALLAVVLDARPRPVDPVEWLEPAAAGLVGELVAAEEAALAARARSELTHGELERVIGLGSEARELAERIDRREDPALLAADLEHLRSGIDRLRRDSAGAGEVAPHLQRASALADAALTGIEARRDAPPGTGPSRRGGDPSPRGGRSAPGTGGSAPGTGGSDPRDPQPPGTPAQPSGEDPLEIEPPQGRMSDRPTPSGDAGAEPDPSAQVPSAGAAGAPPGAEAGIAVDRWWPEHHAGVIRRWVEARRARAAGKSPGTGDG